MPWIVPWNGADRDFDPTDFTGRELSEIKRVAGFTYPQLVQALSELDADALRAVFWTVDRREAGDLRFGDYEGPSMRLVITTIASFNPEIGGEDEPGKAPSPETDGSPSSPNGSDGPDPNTTP